MPTNIFQYLIAFGSNLGQREKNIAAAIEMIAQLPDTAVMQVSQLISTPPDGGVATEEFLNGALIAESSLEPKAVMRELLNIETKLGRSRKIRWDNRTIDLDILIVRAMPQIVEATQDAIYIQSNDDEIILPHPRMLEREFVLIPAAEIAGLWTHPISGQNLTSELDNLLKKKIKKN